MFVGWYIADYWQGEESLNIHMYDSEPFSFDAVEYKDEII